MGGMETVVLSDKALVDLRRALQKSYGESLAGSLTDTELNRIGVSLLTGLVESLKMDIADSEMLAK
jgi:hypothetical protein